MANDQSPEAYAARSELLNRTKAQYTAGAMRPRLCYLVSDGRTAQIPPLKLQWEFYAGMGNTDLANLSPRHEKAAQELLESGDLVAMQDDYSPYYTIRLIKHFDDVRWGRTADDKLVIYQLSADTFQQDELIEPGPEHDAAVQMLKRRIGYGKTMDDAPISLALPQGACVITPILTDQAVIALRQRQGQAPR